MPSSRIRPPTPPTDFQLPPDVTSTRDTLATGAIAYSFRHARLGLLGRLVIRGIAIIGPDLYDKGVLPYLTEKSGATRRRGPRWNRSGLRPSVA